MKISIVIPAYNESAHLSETLPTINEAALSFQKQGWIHEVIVCDNNSSDNTSEIAKSCGCSVVFEPINQIARARNTGAKAATGEWLIFIDADSKPSKKLFECVSKLISTDNCLGGGSTVFMDSKTFWFGMCVRLWNWTSIVFRLAAGSFIFCKRDAFVELNGFNQDLFVAEEIDFSSRLKKLARKRSLKFKIIRSAPLWTSARKETLYSIREWSSFLIKACLAPKKTMRRKDECTPWYDGRRL